MVQHQPASFVFTDLTERPTAAEINAVCSKREDRKSRWHKCIIVEQREPFHPSVPVFLLSLLFSPFAGVSPLLRNEFHYLCLQVRFVRNVSSWREMKPGFYHGHVAYLDFSK